MNKLALFAAATVALTGAMAVPALAGGYCKDGPAVVQNAHNSLGGVDNAAQHIRQGQAGLIAQNSIKVYNKYTHKWEWVSSTVQKQTASNQKYFSDGGYQRVAQFQLGFIGSTCGPAQNQVGKNFAKFGSNNTQKIKQKQFGLIFWAFGNAQNQDASNTVIWGSDNTQKINQSQGLIAGSTNGTTQSQTASNTVVGGDGNNQTIHQSQNTVVVSGGGGGNAD